MDVLVKVLLIGHIAAGFFAVFLFWAQAIARKGGINHRRVGTLYVRLMWLVVISAAILCILSFLNGRVVSATFLGFIALITAKPLWIGIAVINAKKEQKFAKTSGQLTAYRIGSVIINGIIVSMGIVMFAYGLSLGSKGFAVLLMIFGGLGVINVFELWSSINALNNSDLSGWMKEHIVSMGVSGIAAHTAFLVFGANRFLPEALTQSPWSFVPWVAPTLIGTVLIRFAVKRHQPKAAMNNRPNAL